MNTTAKKEVPQIFLHDEQVRLKHPVIAGLDEAGRGPLAGPVVAAAVILPTRLIIDGLRDSKKTTEKSRKKLFWEIAKNAMGVGVGIVHADVIDRINILQSTKLAMKTALEDLGMSPDILYIDAVKLPEVNIRQCSIFKGESISASIAAASIIAKVVRDEMMFDYHEMYPLYNFKGHKGYSTKEHMEAVIKYGPCPIHRKSFRRVKDIQLPFGPEL
ncbi:MAG TPA: ribonuclease HII [Nitrospirae bacterium]|nr:ribonuclease HII [bacterium BMS3Bbin09]HDO67406.1 ribonuclease HII [Nitrospirota bacterium]HDZ84818.1 ribonuclease HII [Nitrospirota bacterium]HEW81580.1 ribonuclease HII [Nitrospirota bacterium]